MAHKHDESCKEIFAMLSQYLDRELSAESCECIEAHLADCPCCIDFLNSLKRTVKLCKCCAPAEALPPLSPEVRDKMLAAYKTYLAANKRE
jgi:predicted anti-sigma-YlaC factor YlaD